MSNSLLPALGEEPFPFPVGVLLYISDYMLVARYEEVLEARLGLHEISHWQLVRRLIAEPVFPVIDFEERPEAAVDRDLCKLNTH